MGFRLVMILALLGCIDRADADIQFACPTQLAALTRDVPAYLHTLGIADGIVAMAVDGPAGVLQLTLATAPEDTRTIDLFARPEMAITDEQVRLPNGRGRWRVVDAVSRKEIVLALLQHGRVMAFKDQACTLEALVDHVGMRQNIVAWAEDLNWLWPNGGPAQWNSKYWRRGTPHPGVSIHAAFLDAFVSQNKYSIGCYTATKLVVVQGILDYFRRVKPDPVRARLVEEALLADGEPLVDVEPAIMWRFEADFNPEQLDQPGKLLDLQVVTAADNFVPGDWGYLLNTDANSARDAGYEGSNALYLGRNRFGDYYNDHRHGYTYEQKLDEVYQWRNGVFNRIRDAALAKPLASEALLELGRTPESGGLQLDVRATPRHF
jgi:hypothetical protein